MTNKGKQAKEYLTAEPGKAKELLRKNEFSPNQKKQLLDILTEEEFSDLQKKRRGKVVVGARNAWKQSQGKKEYSREAQNEYQENIELRKKLFEKGVALEEANKLLFGEESKKESKESPRKALEKERKTAAIAELERLGMKTDENVEKINAIQFLDDKILIGSTPWAYENMTGGTGTFRKETNRRYYNFSERKAEAKNQGIVLPEKKDFEDTLNALPGEYSESKWYKGCNVLSIILGEAMTAYCDSGGCLGSVSEYHGDGTRSFTFGVSIGILHGRSKDDRFVSRPLVKNS